MLSHRQRFDRIVDHHMHLVYSQSANNEEIAYNKQNHIEKIQMENYHSSGCHMTRDSDINWKP